MVTLILSEREQDPADTSEHPLFMTASAAAFGGGSAGVARTTLLVPASEMEPLEVTDLLKLASFCKDAYGGGPSGWKEVGGPVKAFVGQGDGIVRICVRGTKWDDFAIAMKSIRDVGAEEKDTSSAQSKGSAQHGNDDTGGGGLDDVSILLRMNLVEVGDGYGKAHEGFLRASQALVQPLVDHIKPLFKDSTDIRMELLGHDTGGSIATVLSVLLPIKLSDLSPIKVRLVTFGALVAGDGALMARVVESTSQLIDRCVTGLDPVPNLLSTLRSLKLDYRHPSDARNVTPWTTIFKETVEAFDFLQKFDKRILEVGEGVKKYWETWHSVGAYVEHLSAAASPGTQFEEAAVSGTKLVKELANSEVGRTAWRVGDAVVSGVKPSRLLAVAANCAASPVLGAVDVALEACNLSLNAYQRYQLSTVIKLVDQLPNEIRNQIRDAESHIISAFQADLKEATRQISTSVIHSVKDVQRQGLSHEIQAAIESMTNEIKSMLAGEGMPSQRAFMPDETLLMYRNRVMSYLEEDVAQCNWNGVHFDTFHLAMVVQGLLQLYLLHHRPSVLHIFTDRLYETVAPLLGQALWQALDGEKDVAEWVVPMLRRNCAYFATICGVMKEQGGVTDTQCLNIRCLSSTLVESSHPLVAVVNIYDVECWHEGAQMNKDEAALYRGVFADCYRAYEARMDLSRLLLSGEKGVHRVLWIMERACDQERDINRVFSCVLHGLQTLSQVAKKDKELGTVILKDPVLHKSIRLCVSKTADAEGRIRRSLLLFLQLVLSVDEVTVREKLVEALLHPQSVFTLAESRISDEGLRALVGVLPQCKQVQDLYLIDNKIGGEGAKPLAEALRQCVQLQTLNLENNRINGEGAKALAEALGQCKQLQTLDLAFNEIGVEGAKALAYALRQCKQLQTLYLEGNEIGGEGAKALADALRQCKHLQTLDLENNGIGGEGAEALAKAVELCVQLQILDLRYNRIGSGKGAKALARALGQCKELHTLYLGSNGIGDEGAKAIAEALGQCKQLQTLNLHGNNIGAEGAKALADVLRQCKHLHTLDLGHNYIHVEGAKALADALRQCKQLQTLDLGINRICDGGAKALAKALGRCVQLQTLKLGYNRIRAEGAKGLAEALGQFVQLQTLDLEGNEIGDEGAKALAKALGQCVQLRTLELRGNRVGDEGAKALAKALGRCTDLRLEFQQCLRWG